MNNNFNQINDQFATAGRQFADTAAQVNRLALDNAGQVFGLQMAAFEKNVNATFAFWGELAETRDMDGLKALLPRGAQIARENLERTITTGQEVLGQIAKGQFERTSAQVNAAATQANEQVTQAANDVAAQASQQFNKAKQAK